MPESLEYDPFSERNVERPTNVFESFMLFTNGAMSTGFLVIPYAFRFIGLWTGIGGSLFATGLSFYCTHMLVKCSHELCHRHRVPSMDYAKTAEKAFTSDDGRVTWLAAFMRFTVNALILIDLLGTVCVCLVSAGENIQQVVDIHQPENKIELTEWILLLGFPMMFLSFLRSLKFLAPFAFFSNGLIFLGVIITLPFIFVDLPKMNEREYITDFHLWPMFFVTAVFPLEMNTVVLPLEREMKNPQILTKCPSMLLWAAILVFFVFSFIGFFGYWKFGNETAPYITLNLPIGSLWAQSVKIIVAAALFFLVLVPFYVSIEIILESISKNIPKGKEIMYECMLRGATAMICVLVAACFPNLANLLSFISALSISALAFVVPAILDIVVFGGRFLKMHLIKDIIVIVFGLIIAIIGVYEST